MGGESRRLLLKEGLHVAAQQPRIFEEGSRMQPLLVKKNSPDPKLGRGWGVDCFKLDRFVNELLKFHDVGCEVTDALGCFFGGHGVFVEHQAVGFLIE